MTTIRHASATSESSAKVAAGWISPSTSRRMMRSKIASAGRCVWGPDCLHLQPNDQAALNFPLPTGVRQTLVPGDVFQSCGRRIKSSLAK